MSEEKITYEDVREYEGLFKMAPSFLLERFAKKNSNIVLKFHSHIVARLNKLNDHERKKLDIILNSPVEELQTLMAEAYMKTGVKQYKILANPKYKQFIETNIVELKKIVD